MSDINDYLKEFEKQLQSDDYKKNIQVARDSFCDIYHAFIDAGWFEDEAAAIITGLYEKLAPELKYLAQLWFSKIFEEEDEETQHSIN